MARFIGQSAVIENCGELKGFESSMEDGIVEDVLFRGNSFEVRVRVKDIAITGNVPLSQTKIKKGVKVKVFVKKLCLLGEGSTETVINKALDNSGLYYI